MHLNSEEKVKIFEEYGKGKTDTGSPEAQIALFSVRIVRPYSSFDWAPQVKSQRSYYWARS